MSVASVFILVSNAGKQDQLITATPILRKRLVDIYHARARDPTIEDPTPTLADIEASHILFTNPHFKPYVAIGFEYQKNQTVGGNLSLDSEISFTIAQFGDMINDMYIHVIANQPVLSFNAGVDDSDKPCMAWCDYPGERLFDTVKFEVNGNELDGYTSEEAAIFRQLNVPPHKLTAWKRCVAQEVVEQGHVDQPNWESSNVHPSSILHRSVYSSVSGLQTPTGQKSGQVEMLIPLLFWFCTDVRLSLASIAIPFGQRYIKVKTTAQEKLVNLVPRGAGDYTDSGIGGSLNYSNMIQSMYLYVNNIFMNPEIHNIYMKRIGFNLIRVHKRQEGIYTTASSNILMSGLKWPVEHAVVRMPLNDYTKNDSVSIRRNISNWHRNTQVTTVSRPLAQGVKSQRLSLKSAAYSVANVYFNTTSSASANLQLINGVAAVTDGANVFPGIASGDLITFNLTAASTGDVANALTASPVTQAVSFTAEVSHVLHDTATVFGRIVFKNLVSEVSGLAGITGVANPIGIAAVLPSIVVYRADSSDLSTSTKTYAQTIDSLEIVAHGITIYNKTNSKFFNSYAPLRYGGFNLNAPEDEGLLFVTFCLYPFSYQPSGHFNLSRAREFYIQYISSVVNSSVEGRFCVNVHAMNFLLLSEGSAVLRYST